MKFSSKSIEVEKVMPNLVTQTWTENSVSVNISFESLDLWV